MTRLIDNSVPRLPREEVKIRTFNVGNLVFVNKDEMESRAVARLSGMIKNRGVHRDIRCDSHPNKKGSRGFSRVQIGEGDFPSLFFGVFEDSKLIGGLSIIRIKLISRNGNDIQVSALVTPFLRNPGSDAWMNRTFEIFQYLLETKIPTEKKMVTMHFRRFEMPEGANDAFKKMQASELAVKNLDFAARGLRLIDAPDLLPDGRKVLYIEKTP